MSHFSYSAVLTQYDTKVYLNLSEKDPHDNRSVVLSIRVEGRGVIFITH